ncbi:MAG: DNA-binding PadR family transcriptional regulator [Halieaceae bacterium]|jgi:DNA-binding PadR family transcriptional regulator
MALSHAIMTALIDDDMSGYELAKSFDHSLGFFWQASHQQIYQDLRKLSEKGWLSKREVSQRGKPNKISYGLTIAGREAMAEWVYKTSKVQESKDDLFVKLYNLGEGNVAHLMLEIDQRRKNMMQRLYLYEKIRRAHYSDPECLPVRRQGVYLALLGGILNGEQFMQWCDEALELLAKVERAEQ